MDKRVEGHVLGQLPHLPRAAGQAIDAEVVDGGDLETSEKLLALQEWKELTPLQRKIVASKLQYPELSKLKLAEKVGCSTQTITKLFHSANFDRISDELARAGKKELVLEAMDVMKKLLRSQVPSVQLKAAEAILRDSGHLKDAEKTSNLNKNISVTWKSAPKPD
jgi:hypothetical protein